MGDFKLDTGLNRIFTVWSDGDRVGLDVYRNIGEREHIHSALTPPQARQVALALLDAADGILK